jgi:hypothetical protein
MAIFKSSAALASALRPSGLADDGRDDVLYFAAIRGVLK